MQEDAMLTPKLPLTAMPFAVLSRDYWSRGHAYGEVRTFPPRPIEKNVEDMTLDDLIATQDSEPLSESRRSWLATGAGLDSLDLRQEFENGKLGSFAESIPDDSPLWQFDAVDNGEDPNDVERDSARSHFTPYVTVDPNTQRQIGWETIFRQHGPLHSLKVGASADGSLAFTGGTARYSRPFPTKDAFVNAATWLRDYLVRSYGPTASLDTLHERIDLVREALDTMGAPPILAEDPLAARKAYFEEDELLAHTCYEEPVLVERTWTDDEGVDRTMSYIDTVRYNRNGPRGIGPESLYHHDYRPTGGSSLTELGMECMPDSTLEGLLGVTEWTATGYPIHEE